MQFMPAHSGQCTLTKARACTMTPRKKTGKRSMGFSADFLDTIGGSSKKTRIGRPMNHKRYRCLAALDSSLFSRRPSACSTPHSARTKDIRLALAARYVPTSVKLYDNMKESNTVKELGGTYSLDQYGAVLVSGRNEYTHNACAPTPPEGKSFVNSNSR